MGQVAAAVAASRWPKWTGDTLGDLLLEEVHQGEEQGPLQWTENRDLIRHTVRQEVGTWCASACIEPFQFPRSSGCFSNKTAFTFALPTST